MKTVFICAIITILITPGAENTIAQKPVCSQDVLKSSPAGFSKSLASKINETCPKVLNKVNKNVFLLQLSATNK